MLVERFPDMGEEPWDVVHQWEPTSFPAALRPSFAAIGAWEALVKGDKIPQEEKYIVQHFIDAVKGDQERHRWVSFRGGSARRPLHRVEFQIGGPGYMAGEAPDRLWRRPDELENLLERLGVHVVSHEVLLHMVGGVAYSIDMHTVIFY